MIQWQSVPITTIGGKDFKMYRVPFVPDVSVRIPNQNLELDHYAFKYLGTETDMYKILDSNFIDYFEARGDLSQMPSIVIPVTEADL